MALGALAKSPLPEQIAQAVNAGWHWAHWLNSAWQPLPAVQHVLVKPYRYRKLPPSQFIGGLTDEGVWEGYTVLLSGPAASKGYWWRA